MKKKAILGIIPIAAVLIVLTFILAPLESIPGQDPQDNLPDTLPPDTPTPIDNLDFYDNKGSFEVQIYTNYEGNYLYYPIELGRNDMKHPIVVWGDGTFTHPNTYGGLLSHLASHGFVVIAPDDTSTGNGDTMIAAMNLIISQNDNPSSSFYQNLDVDKICVMGHSQGGGTTLLLGGLDQVTCTVPIMPWYYIFQSNGGSSVTQKCPMLLITGTEDTVCPPNSNSDIIFSDSNVPTYYGKLIGADHLVACGDAGDMSKYITAWCYIHLFEDINTQTTFYGNDALIYDDSEWIWDSKNI